MELNDTYFQFKYKLNHRDRVVQENYEQWMKPFSFKILLYTFKSELCFFCKAVVQKEDVLMKNCFVDIRIVSDELYKNLPYKIKYNVVQTLSAVILLLYWKTVLRTYWHEIIDRIMFILRLQFLYQTRSTFTSR